MMGKNNGNSWLNTVKKAFKSPSNHNENRNGKRREEDEQQQQEKKRWRRRWRIGKNFPLETTIQHKVAKSAISICMNAADQENMVSEQPKIEDSLSDHKRAIAIAEAAIMNAVEIIRLSKTSLLVKENEAAVVIQTIFRGYLARRALLALKGVVKMQALIRGHNVRKRAKMTLQCIQSLVRVQALVCDQRRRLSCDAAMLGQPITSPKSTSKNASDDPNNLAVEEIQALIQKAQHCSLKQGNTLAHILFHQGWTVGEDQNPDNNYQDLEEQQLKCPGRKLRIHPTVRKDRELFINQRHQIKTVESDTSTRLQPSTPPKSLIGSQYQEDSDSIASPKTPSTVYLRRITLSENSCPLRRPNYMASTQSAMARVRPHSTPNHRPSSPIRHQMGSARKRLSFPIPDGPGSNLPYYLTE